LEDEAIFIWQNVETAYGLDRIWVGVSQVGKVGEVMLAYEEVCSLPAGAQHSIKTKADKVCNKQMWFCDYKQANAV